MEEVVFKEKSRLMSYRYFTFIFSLFLVGFGGWAGDVVAQESDFAELALSDYTFDPQIHSVTFSGVPGSSGLPVISEPSLLIYSSCYCPYYNFLTFSFDDFSPDLRRFYYTVVPCTYDWKRIEAPLKDFFCSKSPQGAIEDYTISEKTLTPYTHYEFTFPKRGDRFLRSGNYVLQVYDAVTNSLVISRRFMLLDESIKVVQRRVEPLVQSETDRRQEVIFSIESGKWNDLDGNSELRTVVLQNNRWDNAVIGVKPSHSSPARKVFARGGEISFEAGNAFRELDLTCLDMPGMEFDTIQKLANGYKAVLHKESSRAEEPWNYEDLDGGFFIPGRKDDCNLGEYVDVVFRYSSPEEYDGYEMYVFGGLSEFRLKPEFLMRYDEEEQAYVAEIKLKQGVYNYCYALVPKDGGAMETARTEGNWETTENNYTILLYYHPSGGEYDRLVGMAVVSSRLLSR